MGYLTKSRCGFTLFLQIKWAEHEQVSLRSFVLFAVICGVLTPHLMSSFFHWTLSPRPCVAHFLRTTSTNLWRILSCTLQPSSKSQYRTITNQSVKKWMPLDCWLLIDLFVIFWNQNQLYFQCAFCSAAQLHLITNKTWIWVTLEIRIHMLLDLLCWGRGRRNGYHCWIFNQNTKHIATNQKKLDLIRSIVYRTRAFWSSCG